MGGMRMRMGMGMGGKMMRMKCWVKVKDSKENTWLELVGE